MFWILWIAWVIESYFLAMAVDTAHVSGKIIALIFGYGFFAYLTGGLKR